MPDCAPYIMATEIETQLRCVIIKSTDEQNRLTGSALKEAYFKHSIQQRISRLQTMLNDYGTDIDYDARRLLEFEIRLTEFRTKFE